MDSNKTNPLFDLLLAAEGLIDFAAAVKNVTSEGDQEAISNKSPPVQPEVIDLTFESSDSEDNSSSTSSEIDVEGMDDSDGETGETHYHVLGVDKNASESEIRRSYKSLALVYHPDKHANSSVDVQKLKEDRFKKIVEAYVVLSDAEGRWEYDESLRELGK